MNWPEEVPGKGNGAGMRTDKQREIERIEAIIGKYVFYLKGTGEVEGRLRDNLRGRCAREIRAYMMRRARKREARPGRALRRAVDSGRIA